jgi:hypothetical protein
MARLYTNHDHYCHICDKRIDDGEDYYRCARNIEVCIPCDSKYGLCYNCELCK